MLKRLKKHFVDNRSAEKRSINNPNEINTSVKIPMYAPNMGLTPKEYQISQQLNDLEERFRDLCMEFLSKSNPDEFNSSYIDAVIERICIDAIRFVKVQRCDHIRLIMKSLNAMHNGDYSDAKNKLQFFLSDREANEMELAKYRRIYCAGTSFAEEGGVDYGNS